MRNENVKLWKEVDNKANLTAYILDDSSEIRIKKRPSMIICPGGAYLYTSDREAEPIAMKFASLGYNTFVLRYNTYFKDVEAGFATIGQVDERIEVNTNTRYPQPLFDLAKAMLIIRGNVEEWNIDVDNISVCGFSAGGHLAATLGTKWDSNLLKEKFGVNNELFKPKSVILGYPVIDYVLMNEVALKSEDKGVSGLFKMSNEAFFGERHPSDELLKEISPSYNVTSNTVPMFIWHTANDGLVDSRNSLNLAIALAENKIPYELHIFESGPHGLALCDESTANEDAHINLDYAVWVDLASKWLRKNR